VAIGRSIAPGVSIAEVQDLWAPQGTYLNTASYGLPPRPGWDALQAALADWHGGRTSWEGWGEATEGSRRSFARLVDVDPAHVAIGATVSGLVGLIAASLPDGTSVLAPEIEFTSNLFPYLAQAHRGVTVRTVPAAELAQSIDATVDVVAFSAVQMATGEVADFEAITAAAERNGVVSVCDATQAAGWLPIAAGDFDFVVCGAYKWLMCPRGVAFLAVRPHRLAAIVPAAAGWYAGEDVHASYFGPPLRLAADARRLDTSPAWFSWVGAEPALELIEAIGIDAIHVHDVALANHFRDGLALPPGDSAIVSIDRPGAEHALERAGIRAAMRGGRLRVSWHVYNTERDVGLALDALS
jgi:selenocysteine lyase/cysteine desulfurase